MTKTEIQLENKIFVNRTLNLNSIKLIGFDMDYTLATYNVPVFEEKAYSIIQNKLIENYDYPKDILDLKFDKNFIIRGLVIDTENGNVLKVNQFGFVRKASHGTRFFTFEEQKELFGPKNIDLSDPVYYIIHTLFSLAEGCIYAQLVDYYDERDIKVNYKKLFRDVRKSLNDAHQDETLKGDIIENPSKYLIRDERIVKALKRFKKFGKKIALITNSDYDYSRKVMDYCFSPYLKEPWQDLFDLIIVAANKPAYFTEKHRYLKVDPETGLLSNFFGKINWHEIYQGGNAEILEKNLKLSPSEILYIGDHILGDVVTLKEAIGWRTGLVIQELEEEVPILQNSSHIHQKIAKKMEEKEAIENRILQIREKLWGQKSDQKLSDEWDRLRDETKELDDLIRQLIFDSQKDFNPYWGEVMRAGNEISRFATLVERYACIYMSSVANLSYYSPFKYFRSQRRFLAHDILPCESEK